MKKWLLIVLVFSLSFPFCLCAQDSVQSILDPVTITSSMAPIKASATGRNILVIKGDQFLQMPVNSVDELLRYIPGVEMQSRGPMGAQSDIVIRGGTFQQVLVILDGIRLNDPLTGHFSAYIPIAPAEIDRIEILKGAASAIYGTEAVGGVVHIITKSFVSNRPANNLQAQAAGGEYGLLTAQAGGNWRTAKGVAAGGLLTNHATGQPQRGTRGFFDITTASFSYKHQLNNQWSLAGRTAYDYRRFSAQNFYTTFTSDTATERVKLWWNHLQAQYKTAHFQWRLEAGYKQTDDRYKFNSRLSPNQNNAATWQILSVADVALGSSSSLTTGVQWINKTIESNDRGNHAVWQSGLFAILHQQLGSHWFIEPALRLNYNQRGGWEWVPQLNASFKRSIYQLRGSVGRTIRDADFTERFNNYNRPLVPSGSIGNPDLEAETSWSYEAGADVWAGYYFKASATFFSRRQSQLIDFVPTPYAEMPRQVNLVPTGNYALAKNISEVNTTGFETDFQFLKRFNTRHKLQANLGLVWLNSELGKGGEPGFYISSHARFLTTYSIVWQFGRLELATNGVCKTRKAREAANIDATITPSYWVANARVSCLLAKTFRAFLQVDNIGDATYSDLLGSVMPRRWTKAGIQWRLNNNQ
jgi:iron complex outermembrane receptor protein